jgi:hypothetical protein
LGQVLERFLSTALALKHVDSGLRRARGCARLPGRVEITTKMSKSEPAEMAGVFDLMYTKQFSCQNLMAVMGAAPRLVCPATWRAGKIKGWLKILTATSERTETV